jgi:MerR family transcriptional regulator, light-induced transcriptional regulator
LDVSEKSAGAENSTKSEATAVETAARLSRRYLDALRAADGGGAFRIAAGALREGMSVPQLYQRVLAPAMHEIGRLWEKGALTVADEHLATALTNRVLAALRPPVRIEADAGGAADGGQGRALLAAVEGEQHALGLRMAADILEDTGFEAIYLGGDVPTGALLRAIESFSPDLLVLSATMPSLALRLEEVATTARGAHPQLELLLGGQAASLRIEGGTLVEDFEVLPERVAKRPQV